MRRPSGKLYWQRKPRSFALDKPPLRGKPIGDERMSGSDEKRRREPDRRISYARKTNVGRGKSEKEKWRGPKSRRRGNFDQKLNR